MRKGLTDLREALSQVPRETHQLVLVDSSNAASPVCRVLPLKIPRSQNQLDKPLGDTADSDKRKGSAQKCDKQNQPSVKILTCRTNISDHDLQVKLKKAQSFLEKGHKVCTIA